MGSEMCIRDSPAALLRQPQNKPEAFGDFVALRDKIHEVCEHTY